MGGKRPSRPTFAEIVAAVPETSSAPEMYADSIPRPWITVDGQRMLLRSGVAHEGKDLEKILRQDGVAAFHDDMNKRTVIEPNEREAFWLRALSLIEASEHAEFVGYEYKSPEGGRCLVVYESCGVGGAISVGRGQWPPAAWLTIRLQIGAERDCTGLPSRHGRQQKRATGGVRHRTPSEAPRRASRVVIARTSIARQQSR